MPTETPTSNQNQMPKDLYLKAVRYKHAETYTVAAAMIISQQRASICTSSIKVDYPVLI